MVLYQHFVDGNPNGKMVLYKWNFKIIKTSFGLLFRKCIYYYVHYFTILILLIIIYLKTTLGDNIYLV